jgi:hypothetical protein
MEMYLWKDRKLAVTVVTAKHATVKLLTRKVNGHGHKLYLDNYFSFPDFVVIRENRK